MNKKTNEQYKSNEKTILDVFTKLLEEKEIQIMQLSGFTGSVTETVEAVAMIKNLYIYGVILAWGLIAICMLAYHLDKEYNQV